MLTSVKMASTRARLPLFVLVPAALVAASWFIAALFGQLRVLGLGRKIFNVHGDGLTVLPHTMHLEDLHYHEPSGWVFGGSQNDEQSRLTWNPALNTWGEDISALEPGTIVAIDPDSLRVTRLELRNFSGLFNTHGIDLYSPPEDPSTVYILAVNHLPNPDFYDAPARPSPSTIHRARSRLELFHHRIGTSVATHIRSIWHPLIRTPNDVYIKTLNELYVTNDFTHREGMWRELEMLGLVGNTDTIFLRVADPLAPTANDSVGVEASVALKGVPYNNGLGHGRSPAEIAIGRTVFGRIHLAEFGPNGRLDVKQTLQLPITVDNPSYFHDPYAAKTGRDASGYVIAGLARAISFPDGEDPPAVYLVQPEAEANRGSKAGERWVQKMIFQDDGRVLQGASSAVLVAIDPDQNGGKKQARLFVSGPLSKGVATTKIDL